GFHLTDCPDSLLSSCADGLFGQCRSPHQEPVQYQVSVQVLHRLQEVLKDLMVQGLTWRDDVTQEIVSRELSRVPTSCREQHKNSEESKGGFELSESLFPRMSRLPGPTQRRARGPEDPSDPEKMQRYADYMILDPSRSSVHMQTPLLDPYTYHQVRCSSGSCGLFLPPGGQNVSRRLSLQQQYGYQEEEERSLNSLDDNPAFPLLAAASRSRSRGDPLDRDHNLSSGLLVSVCSVVGPAITFRIRPNSNNMSAGDVAEKAVAEKNFLESETGLKVLQGGVGEVGAAGILWPSSRWVFSTLVAMACIGGILVAAMTIACLRHHAHRLAAKKLGLGPEGGSFTHQEYQDLCRQHMASKGAFGRLEAAALGADSRVSSVSSQFSDGAQPSPSSHSSTPSWCEEPAQANMDISTGHMILAYMEDHLRNKDRLMKEWEALCSYQAEPSAVSVAQSDANAKKNRCPDSVPYDHSRVKLKAEVNPSRSDYVNASTIIEHDPRMPAYIATQGPLSHTISDFWQMVWENGCTVIVMMTALVEDGEKQCDRYWPDEGSSLYHIYEVNLVSEHIWCNDFLVRSFYLKNVQTQETRTLTQFHFLSWPAQGIPTSTRPLLDFRRKVNKCYRGRSCPIIVHCSDGTGRTGTYILIDMVLNRMAKGVKEIDIAATLEHVRDQRPGMVRTKDQFEFALTAVAEEVNAILKALPQ
uniref:Protein tyrosine phosphatase receptor type N n=1 Tax=Sparus aurata TaxID=8175 RepID=A0A671YW33_SPAAU